MGRVTDMPVYDVFGFSSGDLEQVRAALENCLDICFVPRESSFRGDYYSYDTPNDDQELILESNEDPEESGPLYLRFSEFSTVLHVSIIDPSHELARSEEFAARLQGAITECKRLEHKVRP